jgi:hypothetical protein
MSDPAPIEVMVPEYKHAPPYDIRIATQFTKKKPKLLPSSNFING